MTRISYTFYEAPSTLTTITYKALINNIKETSGKEAMKRLVSLMANLTRGIKGDKVFRVGFESIKDKEGKPINTYCKFTISLNKAIELELNTKRRCIRIKHIDKLARGTFDTLETWEKGDTWVNISELGCLKISEALSNELMPSLASETQIANGHYTIYKGEAVKMYSNKICFNGLVVPQIMELIKAMRVVENAEFVKDLRPWDDLE